MYVFVFLGMQKTFFVNIDIILNFSQFHSHKYIWCWSGCMLVILPDDKTGICVRFQWANHKWKSNCVCFYMYMKKNNSIEGVMILPKVNRYCYCILLAELKSKESEDIVCVYVCVYVHMKWCSLFFFGYRLLLYIGSYLRCCFKSL